MRTKVGGEFDAVQMSAFVAGCELFQDAYI